MSMQQLAIICANKDLSELELLEAMLIENFGAEYVIEIAESTMEAMDILETLLGIGVETAVLLTSEILLDTSGIELVTRVSKKYPMTKSLLLTGDINTDEFLIAYNKSRIHQIIHRPWSSQRLVKTIAEAAKAYVQDIELDVLNHQLRHSEEEKSLILNSISEAVLYVDKEFNIIWSNPVAKKMLESSETKGTCYSDIYHLKKPCSECPYSQVLKENKSYMIEKKFSDSDYKLIHYYPVLNRQGVPMGIVITLLDITSRKIAEDMNRTLLEISKFINKSENTLDIYKTVVAYLEKYYRLKLMCIAGRDFDNSYIEYLKEDRDALSREAIRKLIKSVNQIIEASHTDDFIVLENPMGSVIIQPLNKKLLLMIVEEEVTHDEHALKFINAVAEQVKMGIAKIENLKKITYQANHDSSTGLYNREYLMTNIDRRLARQRQHEHEDSLLSLASIDLNFFKEVNDTYGHLAGDEVLHIISQRLLHVVRDSDVVARMGGDEFAILFTQHSKKQMIHLIRRLQEAIARPMTVQEHTLSVGSSIGIVYNIRAYKNTNLLLKNVDSAMYEAKKNKSGIGHYVFYEKDVQARFERHHAIEECLKHAVHAKDFELVYQPIMDMRTQEIKGFEGLVRWKSEEGHFFSPDEFIPIADETNEIYPIGETVVNQALDAVNSFNLDKNPYYVSINLTAKQLLSSNYLGMLKRSLLEHGVASHRLQIDISERYREKSVHKITDKVKELREFGVHVNLDDFGTGTSSLRNLHQMKINEIKIDQSLVRQIRWNQEAVQMVKSTISLANALGIVVTAEGVEKKEEFELLKSLGCHLAQGYYISKPMTLAQAKTFIPTIQ